nr:type IV pilus secretin PilQ family protein [Spongiibacter marinus]
MKTGTQKHLAVQYMARGHRALMGQCLLLISLLASAAVSASNLTDVEFNALEGGRFEARFQFDGAAPEVKGYTIEKPARIALDLIGAKNQLDQKKFPLAYDNASSAIVLEGRDRTRVVLNLVSLAPYETRVEGNELVVAVGGGGSKAYLKEKYNNPVLSMAEAAPEASGNRITDLDFRRGDAGEGRLVIKLADDKADINVFVEGPRIKIDFSGVALPESLQRRFDVADFATPVKLIDARMGEKGAKLSLDARGEYDYLAYQTDNEYVVSVKPLTKAEVEERRKEFAFVGEKLSLNFQDIEVRSVLQLIADFTELNLVASDTVKGNITLRLQNVPWDQALELVLKTKGLDKRQVGNVLMVAPAAEIAERERQEIEAQKQVEELAPLQSEFIRIRYADAAELFKLFKNESDGDGGSGEGSAKSILSPRGNVIVDERTNSLLITETADRLEEFRRLVALIDVPVRQVQIEARIVRASSDFDRALGVRWGGAYVKQKGNEIYSANGDLESDQATRNNFVDALVSGSSSFDAVPGLVTDLGVPGAAGSFALGYIGSDVLLNLELSALESKGRGEVVSQPRIVTGDKEPAIIKAGTEIPYPESSASGETTIAFKEAVLKLDVTPIITPDDRIIMDLIINQDTVGDLVIATGLGGQVPTIDTTELQTRVLVSNGETVVLGGVYDQLDVETETKVPFLGDIPFLGRLFKSTSVTREKQETLIFITPRILADSLID